MGKSRIMPALFFSTLLLTGITACEKEGPAERAGKAVDEAASEVSEKAGETMETVEEKLEK